MKKLELNHWFIKDDKLEISLLNLFASIEIAENNQNFFFRLLVIDQNRKTAIFNFFTLEEAVSFVEDKIKKCRNNEEVIYLYQNIYEDKKFFKFEESINDEKESKILYKKEND